MKLICCACNRESNNEVSINKAGSSWTRNAMGGIACTESKKVGWNICQCLSSCCAHVVSLSATWFAKEAPDESACELWEQNEVWYRCLGWGCLICKFGILLTFCWWINSCRASMFACDVRCPIRVGVVCKKLCCSEVRLRTREGRPLSALVIAFQKSWKNFAIRKKWSRPLRDLSMCGTGQRSKRPNPQAQRVDPWPFASSLEACAELGPESKAGLEVVTNLLKHSKSAFLTKPPSTST